MIIKIKNFKFSTILGIYEWEETVERAIILNATIETDYDRARFTNSIKDTIDYHELITKIKSLLSSKKFKLIEEMVQQTLDLIMEDERIKKCEVEIDKVGIVENVDSFSITLSQERKK
ncbi:MAG: dihydroneopterin aldolase [Rickettsiales bacterium]|nr:dihydroneopterin aldolase [Rickettsiales bacterium]